MANSIIEITFLRAAVVDDYISFDRRLFSTPATIYTEIETYKVVRSQSGEIKVPSATVNLAASTFETNFNIDYNGFSQYIISRINNVVTLEITSADWEFLNDIHSAGFVSIIITNRTEITFSLDEVILSTNGDNPCGFYDISLETDELATSIYLNDILLTDSNTNNPFVKDLSRNLDNRFKLENATGDILYYPILTDPPLYISSLTSDNISVNVVNFLNGATLTVNVTDTIGLELEYSLDNVNWFETNIFTGQTLGTKFLYVRDQYDCIKSKEYTVTALGTRTPIATISRANSINFSKVEVWDGCSIFKNDENTLACEGLAGIKYITDIPFQTCDDSTIQIKSNYEVVTAVVRDSDANDTALTVVKKSTNLNRFQRLDAKYYKFREGKLGIFFDSGDTYNEVGDVISEYTLNGNLPEFAIIGQTISIDTLGVFLIVDILTDQTINKRVIIVNYTYANLDVVQTIVESVYDILDVEIYEFNIDWNSFSIGEYSVIVTHTDTINGTVTHKSERIEIAVEHEDMLAIDYSNNNNKDIFYKYGIKHFIRVPFVRFVPKQRDNTSINITDDSAVVVESSVYELNEIAFDVLSGALMRKLVIALSCENLFINGTSYVKDGDVNVENKDNTNLHEVTVTLIKTDVSFTNFKQGITGVETEPGEFDIPQIITTGTNFIKT